MSGPTPPPSTGFVARYSLRYHNQSINILYLYIYISIYLYIYVYIYMWREKDVSLNSQLRVGLYQRWTLIPID
jgi:hypothetical protein